MQFKMLWSRVVSMRHATERCLLLIVLILPGSGQAEAQPSSAPDPNAVMPRCRPEIDGQVYCKFGVVYECQVGGSMERRAGWRWKADILRACSVANPATVNRLSALPYDGYTPEQGDRPGVHWHLGVPCDSDEVGGHMSNGTMYVRPDNSRKSTSPDRCE